jgi:diketogulonate reductase-like aldo/keto reductase
MIGMTDDKNTAVTIAPGVDMPMIGFGTWQIPGETAYTATRYALEVGYRHVDTAMLYRNEAEVGRAVRESGVPREEIFVTTKLPPDRIKRVRATLETSLRSLGLDYVDLWLIHWPPNGDASPKAWQEFLDLRTEGFARAVGVSNYELDQLDALVEATGEAPAVNQIPWTPTRHDEDVLNGNRARGVVVEGFSGLRGADLHNPVLVDIAALHGVTPAQVVLRWHLEHDIIVIPKSVHEDRIRENFDLYSFALTPQETRRVDDLAGR